MNTPPEIRPLSPDEIDALQTLMDGLPDTLEPLDVVMIDGFLCGVLLQPQPVPEARWLPHIADVEGRPAPKRFDLVRMTQLVRRRHDELERAITERDWFDPWVYELDEAATPSETVLPWVAGFATAVDLFTGLMDRHEDEILEPLATLYRHLDPDDLEDADELLAEIETLAPPESLDEAVEDLVRSVLLMADVARPLAESNRGAKASQRAAGAASRPAGARGAPGAGAPRAPGRGPGQPPAAAKTSRPGPGGAAAKTGGAGRPAPASGPAAKRPGQGSGPRPGTRPATGATTGQPRRGPPAKTTKKH